MADGGQLSTSRVRGAIEIVLAAAAAGAVIGAIETVIVARHAPLRAGELPLLAIVIIGLMVALCATIGLPIILLGRALGRHPWIRGVADGLRVPGPPRVEAITRIVVAVVATCAIWGVDYVAVKYVIGMYKHSGGAALLASTLSLAGTVAIVAVAAASSGPLARLARRAELLGKATRGWAGRALGIGALVIVLVLVRAIGTIAPTFDPSLAYEIAATIVALLVASAVSPARYLRRRTHLAIGASVAAALVIGALAYVGRDERIRGAIRGNGLLGHEALVGLWRLTDDDGDRYSDRFGARDCDDGNADVHPAAAEIPGNGRDDNCVLGDAPRETREAAAGDRSGSRFDILLMTIDTLRADHVSAYGYDRQTTPAIDALATRATRFRRAHTANPWTRFALPALIFGRYPTTLPFRSDGLEPRLGEHELPTLATVLRAAGYVTVSSLSPRWQDLENALIDFEETLEVASADQPAVGVADAALAWFEKKPVDRPYFMWLHFTDPHYPYAPATPRFGDGELDRYDAEIAAADTQIARVLAAVATSGRADHTIVVVTSDHGESFGERGVRFHNRNLYDEQTLVPLLIAVPHSAPRVVAEPVSLVDLAPTLLDLVGIAPPAGMSGASLAAVVRGVAVPAHPVLTELAATGNRHRSLVALHHQGYVIIRDNVAWTHEVYDLAADPQQRTNLSDEAIALELRRRLDDAIERALTGD